MLFSIQNINIALDIILVILAIWMTIIAIKDIGGIVGSAINTISVAILILVVAHISETIILRFITIDFNVEALIHRSILVLAFIFLAFGFKKLQSLTRMVNEA